jgi:hypothetical protein
MVQVSASKRFTLSFAPMLAAGIRVEYAATGGTGQALDQGVYELKGKT